MSIFGPWMKLRDLPDGALFENEGGTRAVKSEYHDGSTWQCQCVLLASGEYAHFARGNDERVREVLLKKMEEQYALAMALVDDVARDGAGRAWEERGRRRGIAAAAELVRRRADYCDGKDYAQAPVYRLIASDVEKMNDDATPVLLPSDEARAEAERLRRALQDVVAELQLQRVTAPVAAIETALATARKALEEVAKGE